MIYIEIGDACCAYIICAMAVATAEVYFYIYIYIYIYINVYIAMIFHFIQHARENMLRSTFEQMPQHRLIRQTNRNYCEAAAAPPTSVHVPRTKKIGTYP